MNYKAYFSLEKQLKTAGAEINRAELIRKFTNGRTEHLSEISEPEYSVLLARLRFKLTHQNYKNNKMRRTIIAFFHKMGYQVNGKIDLERLDSWCRSHGHLHKNLNDYAGKDLNKLVTQAQRYYESYIKTL